MRYLITAVFAVFVCSTGLAARAISVARPVLGSVSPKTGAAAT